MIKFEADVLSSDFLHFFSIIRVEADIQMPLHQIQIHSSSL